MIEEIFKDPRNTLDPIAGFDIHGYFYNELEGKDKVFISAMKLSITDNTFILEQSLMDINIIKQYLSEVKRKYEKEELINFPLSTIIFNSFSLGYAVNSSNKDIIKEDIKDKLSFNSAMKNATTYELKDCCLSSIEYGIMPGKRVICNKLIGIFKLINSYKESYSTFIERDY